ncbi:hypothetical protein HELRODRAFT_177493 [Helobdella robusta]|uniref:Uncharacterized protein n=1 Tax=Helobdella robusta TaxID=6412 RepID=T1FBS5_HELRO|nr:hypothetical protein HELRODRAFT_177493 [Helobdella robusta]ESN97856.1 hypothetical protein HELRODRAFT_177493 [Helobdella robusta]
MSNCLLIAQSSVAFSKMDKFCIKTLEFIIEKTLALSNIRSSMSFENRWVLRSALNFVSDGEVVREVGREFQRKGPEKAKADLAKECLTRVKKKREQEDDRKPGRLGSINISDKYLENNLHCKHKRANFKNYSIFYRGPVQENMEIYEKRKEHEQQS